MATVIQSISTPPPIYDAVVEIDERVILSPSPELECNLPISRYRVVKTPTTSITVLRELDEEQVENDCRRLLDSGITSLAIVLLHSWAFDEHELRVQEIAHKVGFKHVSTSNQVMRMVRAVPRGFTVTVDSYTTPLIKQYLEVRQSTTTVIINGFLHATSCFFCSWIFFV